jgi:D-serine ammonia-lyase
VEKALFSPATQVYGFYCHAGNSYSSTSLDEASRFLSGEVEAVNTAAGLALAMLAGAPTAQPKTDPFVLSVGSTPTAHAASAEARAKLSSLLNGKLELHAGKLARLTTVMNHFDSYLGNYPLLDLQQVHTGLIDKPRVAQRVLATVISYYPHRGEGDVDEALCDAGAIAMSKDTGPSGGFGDVIDQPWKLAKVSQEHGILKPTSSGAEPLEIGSMVQIVGQHACLTLAAYPWYYIVDSGIDAGSTVVDIWVPWKGW